MIVVAGVSGHVGSVVARELLSAKQPVRVIVRDAAKGSSWSAAGAEVAVGSLDDGSFLAATLSRASAFFALLPPPPFNAPGVYPFQARVSAAIVEGVRASGVPHVVLLSSVGADRGDQNGPIKCLFHLENDLRSTGTKLTALRPGYFQENVMGLVDVARGMGIFPSLAPADAPLEQNATRDVGAIAAAEIQATPAASEVVDIVGPLVTNRELAEKLGAKLGKTLQLIEVPPAGHVGALQQSGLSQEWAEMYAEMNAGFASGAIQRHGDRRLTAPTSIDETLTALLG
jgi:uncharacterized protein YbjT (DUF2867 family)